LAAMAAVHAPTASVLVVDDDPTIRRMLSICLANNGYKVCEVGGFRETLEEVQRQYFDLAFVDLRLGAQSGMDLIPELQSANPGIRIIMITAFGGIENAVQAIKRGASDYLPKPFLPEQVALMAQKALHARAEEFGLDELDRFGLKADLSSRSPVMQRALALARQAASSEATLLIRGETGTGKGVLARAIHNWSPRRNGPFSVVSCPALPSELLESELFGHQQGSFTGAHREQIGRVAQAAGGTLFLDEIGDLPPGLQPKILRFIQDHDYERLGDSVTRKADVRVVVATNVDLKAGVLSGRFREDLYYRLNVIEIVLPPLRERREDVLPLALGLLASFAAENMRPGLHFSEDAEAFLQSHNWPGNLRELSNAIEKGVIFATGSEVAKAHLTTEFRIPQPAEQRIGDAISLEQLEETHIRRVLNVHRSLEAAAAVLGIDASTLWRKRKKYGIKMADGPDRNA
jgi:NtrC-family two-component system response regulator AlgB